MDTLDYKQIDALGQDLKDFLSVNLTAVLTKLNRNGKLMQLLELLGCEDMVGGNYYSSAQNNHGKILVLGESEVKSNALLAIAKGLNIDPSRIELKLGYDFAKRFDIRNLQYSDKYAVVLVGPMPHKTVGSNGYSSAIAAMESIDGYPKVIRLGEKGELKITKTAFRNCISECLQSNLIAA